MSFITEPSSFDSNDNAVNWFKALERIGIQNVSKLPYEVIAKFENELNSFIEIIGPIVEALRTGSAEKIVIDETSDVFPIVKRYFYIAYRLSDRVSRIRVEGAITHTMDGLPFRGNEDFENIIYEYASGERNAQRSVLPLDENLEVIEEVGSFGENVKKPVYTHYREYIFKNK